MAEVILLVFCSDLIRSRSSLIVGMAVVSGSRGLLAELLQGFFDFGGQFVVLLLLLLDGGEKGGKPAFHESEQLFFVAGYFRDAIFIRIAVLAVVAYEDGL